MMLDKIITRVKQEQGCLIWTGPVNHAGYGLVWDGVKKTPVIVHRTVWRCLGNKITDGLELDHLCRNRTCINIFHLEEVTHAENMKRGINHHRMKKTCPRGHLYDMKLKSGRWCLECRRRKVLKPRKHLDFKNGLD